MKLVIQDKVLDYKNVDILKTKSNRCRGDRNQIKPWFVFLVDLNVICISFSNILQNSKYRYFICFQVR